MAGNRPQALEKSRNHIPHERVMALGGLPIAAGLLALRSDATGPVSRSPTFAHEGRWPGPSSRRIARRAAEPALVRRRECGPAAERQCRPDGDAVERHLQVGAREDERPRIGRRAVPARHRPSGVASSTFRCCLL